MKNYRNQLGCRLCKHVFVRVEHDEANEYFCSLNAGPRPPCGSVAMNESKYLKDKGFDWDAIDDDAFEKWSHGRHVLEEGICDDFVQEPPK